jgi:hypothetical protein
MAQAQSIFIPKIGISDLAALDYWTANDAVYPAGDAGVASGRNNHLLTIYPKDENTSRFFVGVMGKDYGSGVITLDIFWAAPVATGNVVWFVSWERDNPDPAGVDLDVDSFAAEKSVVSAAPPATKLQKATLFFSKAEADGVEPGDPFRIRVRRSGGVMLDTLAGDAQWFRMSKEAVP